MATTTGFAPASKASSRARVALIGPAGSGKTYTALAVGERLAQLAKGKMAVIDTERGSASLYADRFKFDVLEPASHNPKTYIEAIAAAEAAGYAVLVIDSLSHAWMGKDGALEMVDKAAARSTSGSSFAAWRTVTPLHNQLVDAMLSAKMHVIATLRAKTEYSQEKDDRGKTTIRKIGLAPVMRDGIEYEFTIAGDMDYEHRMLVSKSRFSDLADQVIDKPGAKLAEQLFAWLRGDPQAAPAPAPKPAQKPEPDVAPAPTHGPDSQQPEPVKVEAVETAPEPITIMPEPSKTMPVKVEYEDQTVGEAYLAFADEVAGWFGLTGDAGRARVLGSLQRVWEQASAELGLRPVAPLDVTMEQFTQIKDAAAQIIQAKKKEKANAA